MPRHRRKMPPRNKDGTFRKRKHAKRKTSHRRKRR